MNKSDNAYTAAATPLTGFVNRIQLRALKDRPTLIAPDLQLELPADWIIPFPPISGQPATIRFRIRNIGQKPALDFKTHLYMDGVQVGSWQFHHIDEKEDPAHQYQPLSPGRATKTFVYVTPPLKGTHTLRWVIDPGDEVPEQSEMNNIFDTLITSVAKQQLPDLIAKVIEPTGGVELGHEVALKVKVTNQGQIDVLRPFWVFVKSNGMHIMTQEIPTLRAYESVILERPVKSVSQQNEQIDVEVDPYNEINESNKSNNSYTMTLEFAAVDLELCDCRLLPSPQHNGRPVISVSIRNKGTIEATRPFSVHIYEINGDSTQQQCDIIQLSDEQLPKSGEIVTITVPIKGWEYETGKIYVATKIQRQFVVQVDPEFVYNKLLDSKSQIVITSSLFDVYEPFLSSSMNSFETLPDAYFITFPGTIESGVIRKKTFAYIGIEKESGSSSGGGTGSGGGSSDIDVLKPFVETGKWIESLFTDPTDDRVRDVINRTKPHEINLLSEDQVVDMIEKLFDGPTLDEDENAANKALGALSPGKFSKVVSRLGGLSSIDDEIDGQEWKETLNIVSTKGQHLPLQDKLDLIKGLFDTTTYDAEERAIINLVKSMSLDERWEMLRKKGFGKDDFDDQVDGSEWDELETLLDAARIDVKHLVTPLAQPSPMSCWAAATTMLVNWKSGMSTPIRDVVASAGANFPPIYDASFAVPPVGIDPDEELQFYSALGLIVVQGQSPTIESWRKILKDNGPLSVTVRSATMGIPHAVVVTGLEGDGTPDGTLITYNDPDGGRSCGPEVFSLFLTLYDGSATWPLQIIYNAP